MRVLVTGGAGFLGSHLVHRLLQDGADVVILDKLNYASAGLDRLREIDALTQARVLTADLSLPISQGVYNEIGDVDYIIHTAAETHVDRSIQNPLPFIEANVIGTFNALSLAVQNDSVRRFFLISTDEVYGPAPQGHPGFGIDAPFAPNNPYAATKGAAECLGMAWRHTYKVPVTVVTSMNLFGQRQHHEKYIPMVIRSVLRNEMVTIHADAECQVPGSRFYIHCQTLASAIMHLIKHELQVDKVHVAGEREFDNLTLARFIAGVIGKPLRFRMVDFHSSRPGHDLRYALDSSSILATGWRYPTTVEHSLKQTVEWYIENQKWLGLETPLDDVVIA